VCVYVHVSMYAQKQTHTHAHIYIPLLSLLITPIGTRSSVVSVPVLSNKQWVIFPAYGTLNGSVQNMPVYCNGYIYVANIW